MKRREFYINLVITIILWGSAFVGIRYTMGNITPGSMALLRFTIASITILPFFILSKNKVFPKKDIKLFLLSGFLGFFLYNIALNMGEEIVTAGVASFLISSLTIFTGIFSAIFLKERLGLFGWIGIILSFIGIGIISLSEDDILSINYGAILVIIAAISSSLYMILQKNLIKKYGSLNSLVWSIWSGTLFMLIYLPNLIDEIKVVKSSTIAAIVYLGIFPASLAYFTWNRALELSDSATKTSTALYFTPLTVIVMEWLILNEYPKSSSLLGGFFVLLGVYISTKGKKDE
ncbi:MAG: EamA family transporter [Candidatus Cloacimonadota bacterium]|nr:MAG: EamA family transporter [Candidatus Cloacimonadota bacterium]